MVVVTDSNFLEMELLDNVCLYCEIIFKETRRILNMLSDI
jgi:hypothetical protein